MERLQWIAGELVEARSGAWLPVENPATEETIGRVPRSGPEDVDAAVRAARAAWPAWRRLPGVEKAKLLHEVAARLRARAKPLAALLTLEGGKPLVENEDEVEWVAAVFDFYAEIGRLARGSTLPPVFDHQVAFTVKEPVGVVAAIVPFNYPLLLLSWKLAPALAAGNCVVVKPAEQTPLATLDLTAALDHLPNSVVSIVTGTGEEAGDALVRHRGVDLVAFTGSTETGKRIMRLAADSLKKVNLETSGIDPFIVAPDADLEVAARAALWARFLNAGQVCTSAKRIYVPEPIADRFVARLAGLARDLVVGDPLDPRTDMGPMISREARDRTLEAIERAVSEGARVIAGGGRPAHLARGHFIEPTILDHVRHGSSPTREEIFGPVATVIRTRDLDEAIELANDSEYGLGASIMTGDLATALRAAEEIKAGTFWVNDPLSDNDAGPFGGMRLSGIGRELGEEGLDAFRETKHIHLDWVQERKSYWFPYAARNGVAT
jgi:betaine-aldehyde dehydrogenase